MRQLAMSLIGLAVSMVVACGGAAPKSSSDRAALEQRANATLTSMMQKDASLRPLLDRSAGYAVFPDVGKGGFIAGGASGRGVLYERGRMVGFVQLNQASVGAQIGAQSFAELIAFETPADLQKLKGGQFNLSGNASVVALTSGAGAATQFQGGTAVFIEPRGGAMAELSVGGQQLRFQPIGT